MAAVAMLAGGRTRALAGRPFPRPPQAAAGCVVRLAAAASGLRVPRLRVLLLPPVTAATVGATAPAACRGQAGPGWGTLRACGSSLGLACAPTTPPLPYLHCADCWRCPHHSCTPALGSLGAGCRGVGAVGTGKGKPWAKVRPLGAAKGPACPGQRRHWNHRDHGGTSWPCLWRRGPDELGLSHAPTPLGQERSLV